MAGGVTTVKGQNALLNACDKPDILNTNAGRPPVSNFRGLGRTELVDGVTSNLTTPIELIQRYFGDMIKRGFGRILNITSVSVKTPVFGLDLYSGARAGFTAFCAEVCRIMAHKGVTINHI